MGFDSLPGLTNLISDSSPKNDDDSHMKLGLDLLEAFGLYSSLLTRHDEKPRTPQSPPLRSLSQPKVGCAFHAYTSRLGDTTSASAEELEYGGGDKLSTTRTSESAIHILGMEDLLRWSEATMEELNNGGDNILDTDARQDDNFSVSSLDSIKVTKQRLRNQRANKQAQHSKIQNPLLPSSTTSHF